jgi:hypothetical protein
VIPACRPGDAAIALGLPPGIPPTTPSSISSTARNVSTPILAALSTVWLTSSGLLGLDPERLVLWLFARCVQQSPDWPGLSEVARRLDPT